MSEEFALFMNGVFNDVLQNIVEIQNQKPDEVLYLQPKANSAIKEFGESPPDSENPVRFYASTTEDLNKVHYVGEVVGWEDKENLSEARRRIIEERIDRFQPEEGGLHKNTDGVNLLHISGLRRLDQPFDVGKLVKLSDDTPLKGRTRAGGYSYVYPLGNEANKGIGKYIGSKQCEGPTNIHDCLNEALNVVLQGPPGTGKTWTARKYVENLAADGDVSLLDCNWSNICATSYDRVEALQKAKELPVLWEMVQLHPGYAYEDLVRGMGTDASSDGISFVPKDRVVVELAEVAREREAEGTEGPVVLILDEINRCNLASVLGELILVLEKDKRSHAGKEQEVPGWPVRLQYPSPDGGGEAFTLPQSLQFIGTMNTADRSIAMIDYAIRRRFRFIDVVPDATALASAYEYESDQEEHRELAVAAFSELTGKLEEALEARLRVGHTYFIVPPEEGESFEEWRERLTRKVVYEVIPLLREYRAEGRLNVGTLNLSNAEISLDHPESNRVQVKDLEVVESWLKELVDGDF